MSHELRTPLNSLLLLSRLLADNPDANLTARQIEFASTIHNAGSDLLRLIDDILDLSKIEAGRVDVELAPVDLAEVRGFVERAFRPAGRAQGPRAARRGRAGAAGRDRHRRAAAAADPAQPAVERDEVHRARQRRADDGPGAAAACDGRPDDDRPDGRVHRPRHRDRHRPRQARDDLRGVPAGRRHHQPQVRRHRPGAVDQPGAGAAARRGDHGVVAAGRGVRVHPLPARHPAARRSGGAHPRCAPPRAAPASRRRAAPAGRRCRRRAGRPPRPARRSRRCAAPPC